MERSISKNCFQITIGGYQAIIDPNNLIIDTDKEISSLLYQDIKEVFKKYNKRTVFKKIAKIEYPLIIADDCYNELVNKNPSIAYLAKKFDCILL